VKAAPCSSDVNDDLPLLACGVADDAAGRAVRVDAARAFLRCDSYSSATWGEPGRSACHDVWRHDLEYADRVSEAL
jgi:hypothetical protein